jgi:ribose-phosphate pyrophosphokinase
MILYFTSTMLEISKSLTFPQGSCTLKKFSDGELYVHINDDIKGKNVWLLASTQAPAENMLELFFMLNALKHAGAAQINLFISYFAYARQLKAVVGESSSAQVICDILKNFSITKIFIVQPHGSTLLHNFLSYTEIFDIDFFCNKASSYDAIAAPDKGAHIFAEKIAKACNKEIVFLTKKRPEQEQVEIIALEGSVNNKKILLVDDMISTGRTIIESAEFLKKMGANTVSAAAMHGVFSPGAHERLQASIIEKIYVTNTITQLSQGKIEVTDISPLISKIINETVFKEYKNE